MADLDDELKSMLVKKSLNEEHPEEAEYFVNPEIFIHVSVQSSGDLGTLQNAGFVAREIYRNITYGTINVETLEKLDKLPSVISIAKQRDRSILLDGSIPDIKANNISSRSDANFCGYTG